MNDPKSMEIFTRCHCAMAASGALSDGLGGVLYGLGGVLYGLGGVLYGLGFIHDPVMHVDDKK
jgi:hypothetical protein